MPDDDTACQECGGSGVIESYSGVYGTGNCGGPAEEMCADCAGTGEV